MRTILKCGFITVFAAALLQAGTAHAREILYVTNSGGADVTLVDVATNKVIGTIATGPTPHGIAVSPDGSRIYVSRETDNDLIAIDTATSKIVWEAPVGGRPNEIAVSADGHYVYVPVRSADYEAVVDTKLKKKILSIPVGKTPHNSYRAPNGKWIYATSMGEQKVSIIDVATQKVIASIPLGGEPRPAAITNDNKRMYVALTGLHGYVVVDIDQRKVIQKVELPPADIAETSVYGYTPTHGLALTPDNSQLWITNVFANSVEGFALPSSKLIATLPVGLAANWMTFSHDGKYLYVSNPGSNDVSVINVQSRQFVTRIPVGLAPKRLLTVNVPAGMNGPTDVGWMNATSRPSTTDYYLKGGGILAAETSSFSKRFESGELTPETTPAFYHKLGIRGIVFNSRYFPTWDHAYLGRIKQALAEEQRVPVALRLDGALVSTDEALTQKQIEKAKLLLRAARYIGAPEIRVSFDELTPSGTPVQSAAVDREVEALEQLLPAAKNAGVKIAIEHALRGNGDPVLQIIQQTDKFWVGLCLDFQNWKGGANLNKELSQVIPDVYDTRMQAASFDQKGDESSIDYRYLLPQLVNAGYRGPLSIDYEGTGNQITGVIKTRDMLVNLWKTNNEKR